MQDSVPAVARSEFVQHCIRQTVLQTNLCIFFSSMQSVSLLHLNWQQGQFLPSSCSSLCSIEQMYHNVYVCRNTFGNTCPANQKLISSNLIACAVRQNAQRRASNCTKHAMNSCTTKKSHVHLQSKVTSAKNSFHMQILTLLWLARSIS